MNSIEQKNLSQAIGKALGQVRNDFERMGGVSKRLKKQIHKSRMQDFQNNAFNKKARKNG